MGFLTLELILLLWNLFTNDLVGITYNGRQSLILKVLSNNQIETALRIFNHNNQTNEKLKHTICSVLLKR